MNSIPPRGSVVIPAHNELRVISRTIRSLMRDADPGEIQVVVVCNGCTDGTADEVRSLPFTDVAVTELSVASKSHALNAGDSAARAFPRLYLDADVELSTQGARCMLDALSTNECVVGTPEYQLEGCSWLARAYWREWLRRNPYPRSGTGCFGLNESARESFGEFPDVLGDDQLVASMFRPVPVKGAKTVVRVARTIPAILRRRVRIERGNREVQGALRTMRNGPTSAQREREPFRTQPDPPNPIGASLLIGTHAVAILWSRLKQTGKWTQDVSSR